MSHFREVIHFEGLGILLYDDKTYRVFRMPATHDQALKALERFRVWHKANVLKEIN